MKHFASTPIVLALFTLTLGCGSGEPTPTSNDTGVADTAPTPDVSSDESAEDTATPTPDIPVSENCVPAVGTTFRFTELSVVQPTDPDGVVKDLLNDLWKEDIENDIMNIVYQVIEVDEASNILTVISAPASAQDSSGNPSEDEAYTQEGVMYTLLDELKSEFIMSIDGCSMASTEPGSITMWTPIVEVKDTPECEDVNGITLHNLTFTTVMSADGTEITAGTINGVLPGHIGDCVLAGGLPGGGGVAFGWFLEIATVTPNLDTDNDGEMDSWAFDATFKAVAIENVTQP